MYMYVCECRKILDDLSSAGATLQKNSTPADSLNAAAVATLQAQVLRHSFLGQFLLIILFEMIITMKIHYLH